MPFLFLLTLFIPLHTSFADTLPQESVSQPENLTAEDSFDGNTPASNTTAEKKGLPPKNKPRKKHLASPFTTRHPNSIPQNQVLTAGAGFGNHPAFATQYYVQSNAIPQIYELNFAAQFFIPILAEQRWLNWFGFTGFYSNNRKVGFESIQVTDNGVHKIARILSERYQFKSCFQPIFGNQKFSFSLGFCTSFLYQEREVLDLNDKMKPTVVKLTGKPIYLETLFGWTKKYRLSLGIKIPIPETVTAKEVDCVDDSCVTQGLNSLFTAYITPSVSLPIYENINLFFSAGPTFNYLIYNDFSNVTNVNNLYILYQGGGALQYVFP